MPIANQFPGPWLLCCDGSVQPHHAAHLAEYYYKREAGDGKDSRCGGTAGSKLFDGHGRQKEYPIELGQTLPQLAVATRR